MLPSFQIVVFDRIPLLTMTLHSDPRWLWEAVNPHVAGMAGDIAKLFKNEVVKKPGVFEVGAPSDVATLLAREVIQNSADSARELRSELGVDAPEFEIDFELHSHSGEAKRRLAAALDLASLADRIRATGDPAIRSQLGLSLTDCLDRLGDDTALRTLTIVERGTTGMYGPFVGAKSKMYLALVSIGYTEKASGSGGSYGYGKAGLIRGSHIRTVVAYSCFRERPEDPGVTRRLLGMTYWGQHEAYDTNFTGFARLGQRQGEAVVPFENSAADEVALRLGLDVRDPSDDDGLGTTFLLVDPAVESADLVRAIERNWWPAIEDDALTATVFDEGTRHVPRPRRDPVLQPFIEAYDLALSSPDNQQPERKRAVLSSFESSDGQRHKLGSLGLVAESGGWSYAVGDPDSDGDVKHRSLVALLRGPRMIVEYLEAGMTRPFVRGTFIADDDVDDLLRQTEPKAHDAWQTRSDEGGVVTAAPEVAKAVLDRVKRNVNDFRKSLKPPPRPAEDIRLPELEKLFRSLLDSKGNERPPPPPGDRPFSIKVSQQLVEDESPMHLRLEGSIRFSLVDRDGLPDLCWALLTVSFRIMEEGGVGEEVPLTLVVPEGFIVTGGQPSRCEGMVGHGHVDLEFVSAPYRADWTCRLKAEAEIIRSIERDEIDT